MILETCPNHNIQFLQQSDLWVLFHNVCKFKWRFIKQVDSAGHFLGVGLKNGLFGKSVQMQLKFYRQFFVVPKTMSESLDRKYCFLGHFFVLKVRIIFLDTNIVFSLRKRQKIYRYYYTKLPVITVTWGKIHCFILWCMFPWKGSWHTKHSIFFAQHLLGRKGAGVYSTYLPHVLVMYKARIAW